MSQSHSQQQKWEFKVSSSLENARVDQIWPLFEDFFGLNKWFPGLITCHGIHGLNGEPGCIRYCSGSGLNREQDANSNLRWSKERLIAIDRVQMTFSYEILDSNIGFKSYVSTMKVVAGDEGGSGGGCTVEWWISLDPVAGWTLEDLVGKYERGLRLTLEKMEADILGIL